MRPLCSLHERHRWRGRLSPLAFQLAQCFPFRQSWFLFLRDTSQRSGNTTRIPSQGVNINNISSCLAKHTNQADGEILETFWRSARVRDEHAWSLGSSQGKPTILHFMMSPQVLSLPCHYIKATLQMCPIFCTWFSLCSTDCRDAVPEEGSSQTNADPW